MPCTARAPVRSRDGDGDRNRNRIAKRTVLVFRGVSHVSRASSLTPVRVKISDAFERLVSLAFREKTFDKKARPRVTRRVTTYPARAQARPEQVLLRIVQADPTHFFVWCFAGGDAFRSAARADSRAIVSRKRRHGMSTRVARWANRVVWGVSEGSLVFAARARRFRATYLRGPPRAPPTWCVGDPSRTPWRRTGWLACKDASNGVGVNARCDAGWTREFRVANALWRVAELVTRASESTRARRARRLTSRLSVAVARGGAREVW